MHIYLLAFDVATWNECYASPEKKNLIKWIEKKIRNDLIDWLITWFIVEWNNQF